MRKSALLFALCALAPGARATVTLDEWSVLGLTGGYYGTQTEVGSPLGKGFYSLSARMRTFRFQDAMPGGTREEYSAALRRELYHVTVAGRLGTSPPNTERAEYHLAGGEVLFTLYGLALGPEHPELSAAIWESSGPAPAPQSLDRTWITNFRGIYTNTNFHLERPTSILVVVENSWQLEARETWRDRTSLALQTGHDRYNRVLVNSAEKIFLDNVQYPGDPFAIGGWPNNYIAAEAWQRLWENWKISAAFTRLNLLDNGLFVVYGNELEWKLPPHWRLRAGYYHKRRRATETREAFTLGLSYLW